MRGMYGLRVEVEADWNGVGLFLYLVWWLTNHVIPRIL